MPFPEFDPQELPEDEKPLEECREVDAVLYEHVEGNRFRILAVGKLPLVSRFPSRNDEEAKPSENS